RQDRASGFLKKRELLRLLGLGANHDSAQAVAVSVEKFRGGVDNHIGAELDRTLEIRRHESVVHDNFGTVLVAEFADGTQIAELHQRVRRRLEENQARVLLEGALDRFEIGSVDIGERQSEVREHLVEQARRPSVKIVSGNDVVSSLEHGRDGVDGGHSAGENFRGDSCFERGEIGLEAIAGGIRDARIFVAFVFPDLFLDVSGGSVDGDVDRACRGFGFLSGVNGASGETWSCGSLFGGQEMSPRKWRVWRRDFFPKQERYYYLVTLPPPPPPLPRSNKLKDLEAFRR